MREKSEKKKEKPKTLGISVHETIKVKDKPGGGK